MSAPVTCLCSHTREAHQHNRRGSDCALCLCPRWHPMGVGLMTPRALYALAGVIEGGGVLVLAFTSWPVLVPAGMLGLGLLMQWRAGVAKREAVWHEWNRERP